MPDGWCYQCHKAIGQADSQPQVRTVQVCSFCWQAAQGHRNVPVRPSMTNVGSGSHYGRQTLVPGQALLEDVVEEMIFNV